MIFKGLSYLEVLIVIALIAVLVGVTVPFITQYNANTNVISMESTITNAIREAQYYSMVQKNDSRWGICTSGGKVRVYAGTCANPTARYEYTIPSSVKITGLQDRTFSIIRGEPSQAFTVVIQANSVAKSISVNGVGGMTVTKQ